MGELAPPSKHRSNSVDSMYDYTEGSGRVLRFEDLIGGEPDPDAWDPHNNPEWAVLVKPTAQMQYIDYTGMVFSSSIK